MRNRTDIYTDFWKSEGILIRSCWSVKMWGNNMGVIEFQWRIHVYLHVSKRSQSKCLLEYLFQTTKTINTGNCFAILSFTAYILISAIHAFAIVLLPPFDHVPVRPQICLHHPCTFPQALIAQWQQDIESQNLVTFLV